MPNSSAEFKRVLKDLVFKVKEIIDGLRQDLEKEKDNFSRLISDSKPLGTLNLYLDEKRVDKFFYEKSTPIATIIKLQGPMLEHFDKVSDRSKALDLYNDMIKKVQNVIASYDVDKVKENLDIVLILILIQFAKIMHVAIEDLCKCFGMSIYASMQKHQKNGEEVILLQYVEILADFYNQDGSFKYNINEELFYQTMLGLIEEVNKKELLFFSFVDLDLAQEFYILLCKSNIRYWDQMLSEKEVSANMANARKNNNYLSIAELRNYYRDGEVIKIPDNMDDFIKLLNKAGLDEKEQSYIISLIEAKKSTDFIRQVLNDREYAIYAEAQKIIEAMKTRNPEYYVAIENFHNLYSICELALACTDEEELEYLHLEKEGILLFLMQFNSRYTKKEESTTNNLVFLNDYFAKDVDTLDKAFQSRAIAALDKIKIDNKAKFRKVLTGKKEAFVPYEIYSGGISIFFAEVQEGIYLVLGANTTSNGYRDVQNRLQRHAENIAFIADLLRDEKQKLTLLIENEQTLNNFYAKQQERK